MKRFNKTQNTELQEWINKLEEAKNDIERVWGEFVEKHETLCEVINAYNEVLTGVTEWRDDIVTQMTDYQGERSDKWQEGDAGQAYQSWIDEWEGIELDAIEVPDLPDEPTPEHSESLENAPTEADSV